MIITEPTCKIYNFRQWVNKRYAAFSSIHKTIKICTLAVAYSIISKPVAMNAQSSDTDGNKIIELEEVTVQSTLIELKNAETGRSIEVISSTQIQSLPVTTVDELLRYVPGIDAQQRGAFGAQTDFSLRGSNFNQVLVLIDGQKINDPLTAHFNSNIPISPSEIERIEIIRGPASAEYGPDATGGVINIISKTFSKNKQAAGLSADAKLSGGQYNLINTVGGLFYSTDKYRVSVGGLLNKSDGNPIGSGLKNHFDVRDVSLSGQYQLSHHWSLAYRYALDYRDFNAKNFYTDYTFDKAIEKITRNRHQFQLLRNEEKFSTQIISSYVSTDDYYLFSPTSKANENSSGNFSLKVLQNLNFINRTKLMLGLSFDKMSVTSNNRGNHTLNHWGLFSTTSVKPLDQVTVNASARLDYDTFNGAYFIPQLGASYNLQKQIIFRASWGRSIRTADFTEKYNDTNLDTIKSTPGIGNPALKAEKSWNTEAGIDIVAFPGVILSFTGFNRIATDIIDYVMVPSVQIPVNAVLVKAQNYYARNNSKTITNGIESRLSVSNNFYGFNVKFVGGYTFLDIKNEFTDTAKYAMLQPKHLFNGEMIISNDRVTWSFNGLYKKRNVVYSKNYNDYLISSYAVFNTSLDVAVYKKYGYLTMSVYNLFDKKYADFIGAEMPGRWISGGVKFKI